MDKIAQITALKRIQDEIDDMTNRIENIIKGNEITINENVDAICSRIEKELEEIYELTDERIYSSRHITFSANGFHYGLAFDGTQNKMYFLDTETPWGYKGERREYHVVIAEHSDASGKHYYEDGKWRDQRTKEIFAANWDAIKKSIIDRITLAYENHQKDTLKENMRRLRESESRLAKVERKEN